MIKARIGFIILEKYGGVHLEQMSALSKMELMQIFKDQF